MKFVWEESDIKVGRLYARAGTDEVWIIAYHSIPVEAFSPGDDQRRLAAVSLSDGMITVPYHGSEMAAMLTQGSYVPLEFLSPDQQRKQKKQKKKT